MRVRSAETRATYNQLTWMDNLRVKIRKNRENTENKDTTPTRENDKILKCPRITLTSFALHLDQINNATSFLLLFNDLIFLRIHTQ